MNIEPRFCKIVITDLEHFRGLIVTDFHIGKSVDKGKAETKLLLNLSRLIETVIPSHIFILGDLFHYNVKKKDEWYFSFFQKLESFEKPIYLIPGNHDYSSSGSGGNSFGQYTGTYVHPIKCELLELQFDDSESPLAHNSSGELNDQNISFVDGNKNEGNMKPSGDISSTVSIKADGGIKADGNSMLDDNESKNERKKSEIDKALPSGGSNPMPKKWQAHYKIFLCHDARYNTGAHKRNGVLQWMKKIRGMKGFYVDIFSNVINNKKGTKACTTSLKLRDILICGHTHEDHDDKESRDYALGPFSYDLKKGCYGVLEKKAGFVTFDHQIDFKLV